MRDKNEKSPELRQQLGGNLSEVFMPNYCMYLRKSRKDFEAEARGEGETLSRHRAALLRLAEQQKIPVSKIYEEVVSGETIASRPVMQQLLTEVEQGAWNGVLVMEVERLARGDTMDQGLVSQTFRFSGTKIITPQKTYDPNNEFDEEYFEFGLFMSRREYKTINRRLQRGREASVREGKFIGSIAPYGYKRVKIPNDKGYTLEIVPEQAEVVRLIFSLYVDGIQDENGRKRRLGIQLISRKLNEMQIPPARHDYWEKSAIRDMLMNPTYAGKIRWGWRKTVKKPIGGALVAQRPRNYNEDCIVSDGLHEPIISLETYEKAQEYLSENPAPPVGYRSEVKSPLAGIIVCGKCGRKMSMRRATTLGKPDYFVCSSRNCTNVSSPLYLVEDRVLYLLEQWVKEYKISLKSDKGKSEDQTELLKKTITQSEKTLDQLEKQLGNLHDLLERGVYSVETFLERSKNLSERIEAARSAKDQAVKQLSEAKHNELNKIEFLPKIEHLLEVYDSITTPAEKNEMLKEIIDKGIYTKEQSGARRGVSADDFELTLFPKLPKDE